jgi:hypothetical protein
MPPAGKNSDFEKSFGFGMADETDRVNRTFMDAVREANKNLSAKRMASAPIRPD